MESKLSKKHKDFADLIIQGKEPREAYGIVYPKAQPESARVKSSKLLQEVTITDYIQKHTAKVEEKLSNKLIDAQTELIYTSLCTAEKNYAMLHKIAYSMEKVIPHTEYFEGIGTDGYRFATAKERMDAIKLINQMKGFDAPFKVAQTDSAGNDVISSDDIQELHAIVDLLNGKK